MIYFRVIKKLTIRRTYFMVRFFITEEQRLQGAIVLHFIGAIYFFTTIGLVINYYFIPSVECICEDLKVTSVSNIF